jgi:hypothetical protein
LFTLAFIVRSNIYTQKKDMGNRENLLPDRILKVRFWMESGGVSLQRPIVRILRSVEHVTLRMWQMEAFDELISMKVPMCIMKDADLELVCEVSTWDGFKTRGSFKLFNEFDELKSGIEPLILGKDENVTCNEKGRGLTCDEKGRGLACNENGLTCNENGLSSDEKGITCDELIQMEKKLYNRKSKQVPSWHVQLMKGRLDEMKVSFCSSNPEVFVINFLIPQPSYPLKIRREKMNFGGDLKEDLCSKDISECQEEAQLRAKHNKIFSEFSVGSVSNGDLRALGGIMRSRGGDSFGIGPDAGNLLWMHRDYLSRKHCGLGLVVFVESIQWWLSASDPAEIEEALRVISSWRIPSDPDNCEETALLLLVSLTTLKGLVDSPVWIDLFTSLLSRVSHFGCKYRSALINFVGKRLSDLPGLSGHLLTEHLFAFEGIEEACQLYWRLKSENEWENNEKSLLEMFMERSPNIKGEISKQEILFTALEGVLTRIHQQKGPRATKLSALKQALSDPDSGVLSACHSEPLIPGLVSCSDNRIRALVPDTCNVFKSTAFTVHVVFLRSTKTSASSLSLPIILKLKDDLRTDAACLRLFRRIWDLWQNEGALNLFPKNLLYGVLPLNDHFGLVEFIDSVPLSRIILQGDEDTGDKAIDNGYKNDKNNTNTNTNTNTTHDTFNTKEWSLCNHLQSMPDPESANKNFMSSCVGFSLLTHLLGIGDRHLDNLLLTNTHGHLLHIDFSYLFGSDPKPFPPPIKITREMIRGFETKPAASSVAKWNEFKGLCFTALSLLRKKAAFISALIESEFSNFHPDSEMADPRQRIKFVQDRLGCLISQAECLQKFDKLLEESRSAMLPQVMETIHKWAQYWKS